MKQVTTPNIDPFIIYQYQYIYPRTLDGEKIYETRFSHYISHILIHSEPFYDGPVEAVFSFDNVIQNNERISGKRTVFRLPEDESLRFDNWRVFCLREMKASSLDKFPLVTHPNGLEYVYFLHLENKTIVDVAAISANCCIIKDGHLVPPAHPSNVSIIDP